MTTDATRFAYLDALGIDVFALRTPGAAATSAVVREVPVEPPKMTPPPAPSRPEALQPEPPDWAELRQTVASCTRCPLHAGRIQTVFGVGARPADWMVIGEAPGVEEDRRGEPFVGRAGQLLDEMLRAVGLGRDEVFIANILKCRPPGNRDPKASEAEACRGYLDRQIELVNPRLILAVGRIAAQQLLRSEEPVGRLRGRVHSLEPPEIPVVVTYHPAYLLRTPTQKREAWKDLCLARRIIGAGAA
jgi:DNA polymerase